MDAKIIDQIRTYLTIVVGKKGATGGLAMQDALRQLDSMADQQAESLDPQMQHFLKNRSYGKAMDYLDSLS